MTASHGTGENSGRALSETDVLAILDAFDGSGFTSLALRFDATRVAASKTPVHTEAAPASGEDVSDIPSPSVGTFRLAGDGPGPGNRVDEGCVLGSLRLLTTEVEVRSERSGTLTAVLVDNGAFVEYGQPLVQLQPDDENLAGGNRK